MNKLKVVQWENKNFFLVKAISQGNYITVNENTPYACIDCYFVDKCQIDLPCKPGYFLKECLPIHYLLQEIEENKK